MKRKKAVGTIKDSSGEIGKKDAALIIGANMDFRLILPAPESGSEDETVPSNVYLLVGLAMLLDNKAEEVYTMIEELMKIHVIGEGGKKEEG